MRPLLALIVVCAVLGGLRLYLQSQNARQAVASAWQPTEAGGKFDVEITLSFDAGPDEFALDTADANSLVVEFAGRRLVSEKAPISAGQPILIADITGVTDGANEFYVRATPQTANPLASNAIRIRILHNGVPLSDQSLWSAPGAPTEGIARLNVANPNATPESQNNE